MGMALQQFVHYNWETGLAGTGANDFGSGYIKFDGFGPQLAESWQIPEIGTWVLNIRKGVRYALDPTNEASRLMNGREFTADDAVWNVQRLHFDPKFPNSGPRTSIPQVIRGLSVAKTGNWEVTLKTTIDPWTGFFWITTGGCSQMAFAKEVIEKWGDANDWRRNIGTGPFIWTDYVSQSVATFTRNPNYWEKNPAGPGKGDQLPYVETVKQLVVPDLSTRMAVMRTGRADWITNVESTEARGLLKTNPNVQYKRFLPTGYGVHFRIEKKDIPFKDKRVRQALMMATDFESIKKDYYEGDAEYQVWPIAPSWPNIWIPLKDLPEAVQKLYKYNPEEAKKLLAEAGYPSGFKTKMIVQNSPEYMDPAAAFKAMWAKVGVDVELQPREFTTYTGIQSARSWDEMFMGVIYGTSILLIYNLSSGIRSPVYGWSDPVVEETYQTMQKSMFVDMPKADEAYRKNIPYIMEQAFIIPRPSPYSYTIWQPWVKNHYGETDMRQWIKHSWIDRDLKEKLIGRR